MYPPQTDAEPRVIELLEKVSLNAEEIAEIDARTKIDLYAEAEFRKRKAEMEEQTAESVKRKAEMEEAEVSERIQRERRKAQREERKAAMDDLERKIKYFSDKGDSETAKKFQIELEKLLMH